DRQGMGQALIKHAKHDIDRDQRGQQQQRLRPDGPLEGLYVAREIGMDDVGDVQFRDSLFERRGGVLKRGVWCEVVGDGHRGELALMIDHEWGYSTLEPGYRR